MVVFQENGATAVVGGLITTRSENEHFFVYYSATLLPPLYCYCISRQVDTYCYWGPIWCWRLEKNKLGIFRVSRSLFCRYHGDLLQTHRIVLLPRQFILTIGNWGDFGSSGISWVNTVV